MNFFTHKTTGLIRAVINKPEVNKLHDSKHQTCTRKSTSWPQLTYLNVFIFIILQVRVVNL